MTILRTISGAINSEKGKAGQLATVDLGGGSHGLVLFDGVTAGGHVIAPTVGSSTTPTFVAYTHRPSQGYTLGGYFRTDAAHYDGAWMSTYDNNTNYPWPQSPYTTIDEGPGGSGNGVLRITTSGQYSVKMVTTLTLPGATAGTVVAYGTRPTFRVGAWDGGHASFVPRPLSSSHIRWGNTADNAALAGHSYSGSLIQRADDTVQWTDEYYVHITAFDTIFVPEFAVYCPTITADITSLECGVTLTKL